MAAETFFHNLIHPVASPEAWEAYVKSDLKTQFFKKVVVKELGFLLGDSHLMKSLEDSKPDVVVGGPPCQGFSLAGRRNPEDARNSLPWQFLELVEKTRPKMVVIENVVGMRHKFSSDSDPVFDQLQTALKETRPGYVVQAVEVNALHYGAPQHRPRLMIIGLRQDLAGKLGVQSSGKLWKSNFLDKVVDTIPALAPRPTVAAEDAPTVRDALAGLGNSIQSSNLQIASLAGNWGVLRPAKSNTISNHVVRSHQETSVKRFRVYQWLASLGLESKFLSTYSAGDVAVQADLIAKITNKANFPAYAPDGCLIAASADDLQVLLDTVKTKKHSQRVLALDEPARTVVTIGDDYVHPLEPRTFTVRELARFQGFPDSFEFRAKETTGGLNRRDEVPQYSQVGNAVSPFLARAVGKLINEILG
jgi:DNA (cytosine-5)-methyltransferase 1